MHYAIIAAGDGSRLVSEGIPTPKPLIDIDGTPMISRLMDIMLGCQPQSISVIINEYMTQVNDYLRSLSLPVPLNIVVRTTPSSMHSFYHLSRVLPQTGKFILTTVDTIFRQTDFDRYVRAFQDCQADGMMAVTPYIDDEKPLYVKTSPDGRIEAFLDQPPAGESPLLVSGGIYGLTPAAISVLERCVEQGTARMRNYQRALIENHLALRAFVIPKIMDIDHAADILKANKFLSSPDPTTL